MNTTVHRVSNYKCAISQANFVGNCSEISVPFPVALCRRLPGAPRHNQEDRHDGRYGYDRRLLTVRAVHDSVVTLWRSW